MKDAVKPIRCWRIRAGSPFGVHLWFDPRVEHVELLDGPVDDLPLDLGEDKVNVDTAYQVMLPWNGMLSMSARGERGALCSDTEDMSEMPEGLEDIPF